MKPFALLVFTVFVFSNASIASSSLLKENAKILNLVTANKDYNDLINKESEKNDVGNAGENGMRAIKVSFQCGEECINRYLVLREFWQGHGGPTYYFAVLVDIKEDNEIIGMKKIDLTK